MKRIKIKNGNFDIPVIGFGCWRWGELESANKARDIIDRALELGIDFVDHADFYGDWKAESLFGEAVTPEIRHRITLQTKCGIRPGIGYDFSKEYILKSVEGSLKRLNTDYIDILLLHRPDALVEPDEVAEAFSVLENTGKVRYFGVSNHNSSQIELLNRSCNGRVLFNQMQLSIPFCPMIDEGLNVNTYNKEGLVRDNGLIDYCRLNDITIQAWSPFQGGPGEGVFFKNEKYSKLNKLIGELADKYHTNQNAIAAAWILRHPAHIQVLTGTINPERLSLIAEASDVEITREEWYALYLSAGKPLP